MKVTLCFIGEPSRWHRELAASRHRLSCELKLDWNDWSLINDNKVLLDSPVIKVKAWPFLREYFELSRCICFFHRVLWAGHLGWIKNYKRWTCFDNLGSDRNSGQFSRSLLSRIHHIICHKATRSHKVRSKGSMSRLLLIHLRMQLLSTCGICIHQLCKLSQHFCIRFQQRWIPQEERWPWASFGPFSHE